MSWLRVCSSHAQLLGSVNLKNKTVSYFTSREIAIQNMQTRQTTGKVKEQRTGALFYREKGGCWERWL